MIQLEFKYSSFLSLGGSLLVALVLSLVHYLLLGSLVLAQHLPLCSFLVENGLLPLLDLQNGVLSQCLFVLWLGVLHFGDGIESDALDGPFLPEDSLLLLLASVVLLTLTVEPPPGGGPSELLGLDLSEWLVWYLMEKTLDLLKR